MNNYEFDAEITRNERTSQAADRNVWSSASEALRERTYRTDAGVVRVRVEWPPHDDKPSVRLRIEVADERERSHARDIPAFVELFFHEVFLLFNIAAPGSFGGIIAVSGGEYRIRELSLDARIFETASPTTTLPLASVVAWYDSLGIGTRQVARTGVAKTLFHLLHLARGPEDEVMTTVRLTGSPEPLDGPVIHPMHDEVLDPEVETIDWTEAADRAASAVIADLQSRVRAG